MTNNTTPYTGLYIAADSFLHRLDPRTKLIVFPGMIFVSFMLRDWLSLAILFMVMVSWLSCCKELLTRYFRMLRTLRFLLLFTLLVYLMFTPGYTLWGLSWLSRDGFYQGLTVCVQLALATGFSVLISSSTLIQSLAVGAERLLLPLGRVGVPVGLIGQSLFIVLFFLDSFTLQLQEAFVRAPKGGSMKGRLEKLSFVVSRVLDKNFKIADAMALDLSAGKPLNGLSAEKYETLAFSGRDYGFAFLHLLVCIVLWGLR